MRWRVLAVTALLAIALVAAAWPPSRPASPVPQPAPSRLDVAPSPLASSSEFGLNPGDGEWRRFSPSSILIRFANTSRGLRPEESNLLLDGVVRPFGWVTSTQTVEALIPERLADGLHRVEASLVHSDASVTELAWTFGLDTQVPEVEVEPFPSETASLSLEVRGHASDAWLDGLTVQGREVNLFEGNFSLVVRVWPGMNDVIVEARDLAGNLGRVSRVISFRSAPFEGPLEPRVAINASFAVDLPADWIAQENVLLPSGNRADLIAISPVDLGLGASLLVASGRATQSFSEDRALDWMNLVLASVEATGQLKQVVSRPRLVDNPPGTGAVRATFLRQTASTLVAFNQITMVWSQPLHFEWVILASADERLAAEMWPALDAAVSSFRVLDEGIEEPGTQDAVFSAYTAFVLMAIAVLVAIGLVAVLPPYIAWRKAKHAGRWRPPRNWGL